MKLDLNNYRIQPSIPVSVYNSSEGSTNDIKKKKINSQSEVSFKSKQPKIDNYTHSSNPKLFYESKVDNRGKNVFFHDNIRAKNNFGLKNVEETPKNDPVAEFFRVKSSDMNFSSKSLNKIRDKVYDINDYTIQSKLEKGKINGPKWSVVPRDFKYLEPSDTPGAGGYDIYRENLGKNGTRQIKAIKFQSSLSGREPEDPYSSLNKLISSVSDGNLDPNQLQSMPVRLERRFNKVKDSLLEKYNQKQNLATEGSVSQTSLETKHGIKFDDISRFESKLYKQENYVKTSGMRLGQDYDQVFDKKIKFSLNPKSAHSESSAERNVGVRSSESSNVDVDVGTFYSMTNSVNKSPIKYSAAFRSSAEVGMKIEIPTSGINIGPGSFPGSYKSTMNTSPSSPSRLYIRDREFYVRPSAPDSLNELKKFSQIHSHGPKFTVHDEKAGNNHLKTLIKSKMGKIYPRLARKKFPEPKPIQIKMNKPKIK